jgi:hypothetical protein
MDEKLDLVSAGVISSNQSASQSQPDQEVDGQPLDSSEVDQVNEIVRTMNSFMSSLAAVHVAMQTAMARLSQLETFVGYLIEKDPVLGPKFRAKKAAETAAVEAQDENKAV